MNEIFLRPDVLIGGGLVLGFIASLLIRYFWQVFDRLMELDEKARTTLAHARAIEIAYEQVNAKTYEISKIMDEAASYKSLEKRFDDQRSCFQAQEREIERMKSEITQLTYKVRG